MSDGVAEWYWDNPELFARAWLDGYEVEKEKRYLVKVKNVLTRQGALNRNKKSGRFIFSNPEENSLYDTKFTRKELEDAGFGWVFDCEGIEIEEVE
jgi:phage protein